MIPTDVSKLAPQEKFQLMEALWDDMREIVDGADVPDEHKELLDGRRSQAEADHAELIPWAQAKADLIKG
ncbi:addiction module protein [Sulfuriroseicoccus oceanibius]|uniref:Addiction module protein n=1 Tax=Sulfuriroseicoccus oceanibius TaxID=2707525 RepID=A0A6B3L620_9BACT|nr:addiction module protein [Sulfuriroseicoccus oceanibius]QQL44455.1 addiction module protein [Sulfuriroseicoccus oceanibius]